MPRERLSMRKIHDVLRLHAGGLSKRRIAVGLNIGRAAVGDYLRRARRAGLAWPLPEGLSDEALERLLFAPPPAVSPDRRPLPDWPLMHRELKQPGMTLAFLWEEYRAVHRDGYGYSRFCDLYRDWRGRLAPTIRQTHVAGEKLFVDYAGATADVIDRLTGEVRTAQIFVATLGASSYTYAEAIWTQALPDWIGSHSSALAYFGGVPRQVVPDNLKSGVVKACLYDPEINRTYAGMAAHYDTATQYHPRMMLALMIYCYANGTFSSRRIERATHRDIGVRFVAANRHPDHDTIARFRRENFAAVSESFLQVLLLAKELKLLRVGLVSVDGSKFKANASKHRSVTYERAGALITNWKARSRRFWAGRRRQTRLARMIPKPCRRRLPAARPCATSSMRPVAVWRRRLRRGRQRSTRPTRPKWRRGRSAGVVPRASIRSRRPRRRRWMPAAVS